MHRASNLYKKQYPNVILHVKTQTILKHFCTLKEAVREKWHLVVLKNLMRVK